MPSIELGDRRDDRRALRLSVSASVSLVIQGPHEREPAKFQKKRTGAASGSGAPLSPRKLADPWSEYPRRPTWNRERSIFYEPQQQSVRDWCSFGALWMRLAHSTARKACRLG